MTYDRTGWAVKFVGEIRLEGRQEEELEFRKYHRKMDYYYYYYYIFSSLNLNMYIYISMAEWNLSIEGKEGETDTRIFQRTFYD